MKSSLLDWSNCTPTYTHNNTEYYDPFQSPYKNMRYTSTKIGNYTITAKDVGRLPLIAYNIYGDTALWRAILVYNGLMDPIRDIYPGRELLLPDKSELIARIADTTNSVNSDNASGSVTLSI